MMNATLRGKPDAGNPHVRFDEGEVAPAKPRRGSLLYNAKTMMTTAATMMIASVVALSAHAGVSDLGVVDAHKKVECGFSITNNSTSSWFVQGARSSCACMVVEVRRGEMKAGEVLPVKVVFDPQGMEGAVEKSVQVDLRSRPPILRTYRAQVRLRLGYKPRDIAFGIIGPSEGEKSMVASLVGFAAEGVTVTAEPPLGSSIFTVQVGENKRDLRVSLKPNDIPQGTYCEVWKVKTTDPEVSEIRIPISVRIASGFSITPQKLTVRADEAVCSRQVIIRPDNGKAAFKVLSAETKPRKWGDVRVLPRPLNGWAVVIENIDPAAVRQFSKQAYLEISTDLPENGILKVPLQVE